MQKKVIVSLTKEEIIKQQSKQIAELEKNLKKKNKLIESLASAPPKGKKSTHIIMRLVTHLD